MKMRRTQLLLVLLLVLNACDSSSGNSGNQNPETSRTVNQINPEKKINCFIYHRFGDSRYPSTNISLDNFRDHLNYLKEADFEVLTFSEAIRYLKNDDPRKNVAVLTIDDAFESFYKNGLTLLEEYGFPATLFVNTKTVGGSSYMDWGELKDATQRGIEIGNHTHSHDFILNIDPESRYEHFESEIKKCQNLIMENLGIEPKVFAYPYGEFDERMKVIVEEAGFIAAAAQNSGVINYATDLMACPRFPMATGFDDISGFRLKANAHSLDMKGSPEDHLVKSDKPRLTLSIEKGNLRIDEMQCFIQGSDCDFTTAKEPDGKFEIRVIPKSSISGRRRTLYTLTVQDQSNQWYWYSFLWINPTVEE